MHDTLQKLREPWKNGDGTAVTDITRIPTFKNWCRSSNFKVFVKNQRLFFQRLFKSISFIDIITSAVSSSQIACNVTCVHYVIH